MQPLRTLLSVPGNRHNMIHKARDLTADVIYGQFTPRKPRFKRAWEA